MSTKFDLNKCERNADGHWICQTRDGCKARIVCANRLGERPLVVLIEEKMSNGEPIESYASRLANGKRNEDQTDSSDLINLPRKVKRWVNVYPGHSMGTGGHCLMWETEAEANAHADRNRVACVPIEWEEQ